MRHATFAQWSSGDSFVHALDPRVKLVSLACFVVALALVPHPSPIQLGACLLLLLIVVFLARLPAFRIFQISLFSVPFVGFFAVVLYLSGDAQRAWAVLAKSYLSAFSVLVVTASTPLARLVAAGHYFRMPELLLQVTQLIYRYFFVVSRQAHGMQTAFRSRAGRPGIRALHASSGMIAVLFGRSYNKAAMVHQAMLGRCFSGKFPAPSFSGLRVPDFAVMAGSVLFAWGLHLI